MKPRDPPPGAYALFFHRLALVGRSGLPLRDALAIMVQDSDADPGSARMIAAVEARLRAGSSLADALQQMPESFPAETVGLVREAEGSERAAASYALLAADYEHRARFRLALRAAVTWPMVALLGFVVIFFIAAIFVMPMFKELYASFGVELPAPTRALFGFTQMFGGWGAVLLVLLPVAALVLAPRWSRHLPTSERRDRWLLRLPVVGPYLRKTFASRLVASLLATLHGAPLRETLANLRATTGNLVLAGRVAGLEKRVAAGRSLGEALRESPDLPASVRVSAELGERGGDLEASLQHTRDVSDEEAAHSLVRLEQAVLVATYVVAGVLIGFTVIALYLPIFKLGAAI
jgi:type IV pilus assembly protein PilC